MRRRLGLAAVAALLSTIAFVSPARSDDTTIQPGDYAVSGNAGCTLGFAFDGVGAVAGRVFFALAAHCVEAVGSEVGLGFDDAMGDVVARGDPAYTATDWALVEVRPGAVSRVRGDVRGLPAYPLGVGLADSTLSLDGVRMSGWGVPFFVTSDTREGRWGTLSFDDSTTFGVTAPIFKGDSGGPVVHVPTGTALGIVSRVCVGICTTEGPTVAGILAAAAEAGFALILRPAGGA
jgi:hypothetical protein